METEFILVEWNPPADRERLSQALRLPEHSKYLSIRVIEVPHEIHKRYKHSERHQIHGAVACNAGLYRARGTFSVIRVCDAIWSNELVERIAVKDLDSNTKYRCTRIDVDSGILSYPDLCLEKKLQYCRDNKTLTMKKMRYYVKGLPPLRLNSDGDFQLMPTEIFRMLRGYLETVDVNSPYVDGLLEHCAYAAGISDVLWEDLYIYKIEHGESYRHRIARSLLPMGERIWKLIPPLLLGPVFIRFARITGLTGLLYDNRLLKARGIKMPSRKQYYQKCLNIVEGSESYVLNPEEWGLCNEKLHDEIILSAGWERNKIV